MKKRKKNKSKRQITFEKALQITLKQFGKTYKTLAENKIDECPNCGEMDYSCDCKNK